MSKIEEFIEGFRGLTYSFDSRAKMEELVETLSTLRIANDDEVIVPREASEFTISQIIKASSSWPVERISERKANYLYDIVIEAAQK